MSLFHNSKILLNFKRTRIIVIIYIRIIYRIYTYIHTYIDLSVADLRGE